MHTSTNPSMHLVHLVILPQNMLLHSVDCKAQSTQRDDFFAQHNVFSISHANDPCSKDFWYVKLDQKYITLPQKQTSFTIWGSTKIFRALLLERLEASKFSIVIHKRKRSREVCYFAYFTICRFFWWHWHGGNVI